MELLFTRREWSELGSRDIDGKAERPSERARTSQWISELGIYDYRHRMYDPDLGRFLQSDPTGFDAGDMNLFRYCGDDPVDRSDPTGLASSPDDMLKPNLTMFGQGDWMRLGSPFTNGDLLSRVQNYLSELKSSVDREVNKANAESRDVKWTADYSNWLKSSKDFKNASDIATTDLSTKSAAVMNANGTVARFNVNLHIDIKWNADQSSYFRTALRTDTFGLGKTGEIEHARDALTALTSSYGGSRPARAIANEQAASMLGQSISQEAASSRMDAALVDWRIKTTDQSREDRDASWQHRYGIIDENGRLYNNADHTNRFRGIHAIVELPRHRGR